MTVQELGDEYLLLTDSQDVLGVLESIGKSDLEETYPAIFVMVGEAEYLEVFGCFRAVPRLGDLVERIL